MIIKPLIFSLTLLWFLAVSARAAGEPFPLPAYPGTEEIFNIRQSGSPPSTSTERFELAPGFVKQQVFNFYIDWFSKNGFVQNQTAGSAPYETIDYRKNDVKENLACQVLAVEGTNDQKILYVSPGTSAGNYNLGEQSKTNYPDLDKLALPKDAIIYNAKTFIYANCAVTAGSANACTFPPEEEQKRQEI